MFFDTWRDLLRVILVGVPAYVGLVLILRISGKRTLSKMNAFDLVVTVSLGSILATVLLSSDVALAEGLTAFVVLIGLQFVITWSTVRSARFQRIIKARPSLLAFRGDLYPDVLKRERVTAEELAAAVRDAGLSGVSATKAVVLETDGTITVLPQNDEDTTYGSLEHVHGLPDPVAERLRD